MGFKPSGISHHGHVDYMLEVEPQLEPLDLSALPASFSYKLAMLADADKAALSVVTPVGRYDGFQAFRPLSARHSSGTMGRGGLSRPASS